MRDYHKYAVLFILTDFYTKLTKLCNKLCVNSSSVAAQLMHTCIIQ